MPFKLHRRSIFALLRKIAFGLHLAWLCEGHGRSIQLLFLFLCSSVCLGFLLPLLWSEHVPIDGIPVTRQLIERHEIYIGSQANTGSPKLSRLTGNRFQPVPYRLFRRHKNRRIRNGGAFLLQLLQVQFFPQVSSQHQRSPQHSEPIRIVRENFFAQCLRQD